MLLFCKSEIYSIHSPSKGSACNDRDNVYRVGSSEGKFPESSLNKVTLPFV